MARKDALQLAFDFSQAAGQQTTDDAPSGERRRARKLSPPVPPVRDPRLATRIERPGSSPADEARRRQRDTRRIGATLTTGVAGRRALEDVRATYDMFPVASTRVAQMGYNEDTQIVRVIFNDGTPWQYFDVSPQEWHGFKNAESPGRYINQVLNEKPYGRGNF